MKRCQGTGCTRDAYLKGLCRPHYDKQWRKYKTATCSIDGCDKKSHAKGWCQAHYVRWKKTGTTDLQRVPRKLADLDLSFLQHRSEAGMYDLKTPCWIWSMGRQHGYGVLQLEGKRITAHRLAWQLSNGPIPEGAHVLHKCNGGNGSHGCCNPNHLELGDSRRNAEYRIGKPTKTAKRLSLEEAEKIRELLEDGKTVASLVETYGVSRQQIYNIKNGKSWASIGKREKQTKSMHQDRIDGIRKRADELERERTILLKRADLLEANP